MKTQKWLFVVSIITVSLVAAIVLVPMALAQGPVDGDGPGYGNAGFGFRMDPGDMNGPEFGMMSQRGGPGNGPGFVDADGDGVCDNFVDEDGDGVCDNAGSGQGPGFVDEDGDGVCDHAGTGQQGARRGRGMGRRIQ